MKVRLMAPRDQIDRFVTELRASFDLLEVSRPYPCRGDSQLVRVYVEVQVR